MCNPIYCATVHHIVKGKLSQCQKSVCDWYQINSLGYLSLKYTTKMLMISPMKLIKADQLQSVIHCRMTWCRSRHTMMNSVDVIASSFSIQRVDFFSISVDFMYRWMQIAEQVWTSTDVHPKLIIQADHPSCGRTLNYQASLKSSIKKKFCVITFNLRYKKLWKTFEETLMRC